MNKVVLYKPRDSADFIRDRIALAKHSGIPYVVVDYLTKQDWQNCLDAVKDWPIGNTGVLSEHVPWPKDKEETLSVCQEHG